MPLEPGPEPKPKAPTKKPAARRPPPPRRNLQDEIGSVLVTMNLMIAPFVGRDALDDAEIVALAKGMNEQAQRSPRFRAMLERSLAATGASSLIGVVLIIIGRRAARHGAINPVWDQQLEAMLRIQNMELDPTDTEAVAAAAETLARTMTEHAADAAGPNDGATPTQ